MITSRMCFAALCFICLTISGCIANVSTSEEVNRAGAPEDRRLESVPSANSTGIGPLRVVRVLDGDELEVVDFKILRHGQPQEETMRVRVDGIVVSDDAMARDYVTRLLENQTVRIHLTKGWSKEGRCVYANVWHNGSDLGSMLVEAEMATWVSD